MNKKDYDVIAEINKRLLNSIDKRRWYGDDTENAGTKQAIREEIIKSIKEQADYFEREEKEKYQTNLQFDKEQFLKDCGVAK